MEYEGEISNIFRKFLVNKHERCDLCERSLSVGILGGKMRMNIRRKGYAGPPLERVPETPMV